MTEVYLIETGGGGKCSEGAGHLSEGLHSFDAEGPRATAAPASTGAGTRLNLRDIPKTRTSFRATSEGLVLVARGGSILGKGRLDEAPSGGPRVGTTVNVTLTLTVVFWQLRR